MIYFYFQFILYLFICLTAIRPDRTRGGRSNYETYSSHPSVYKTPTHNPLEMFLKDVDNTLYSHKSPIKKFKIQVTDKQKLTISSSPKSSNPKRFNTILTNNNATNPQSYDKSPSFPKISNSLLKLWAIESSLQNSHSGEDSLCSVHINDVLSLELVLHLADHCLYSIVRWARSVPNFTILPVCFPLLRMYSGSVVCVLIYSVFSNFSCILRITSYL